MEYLNMDTFNFVMLLLLGWAAIYVIKTNIDDNRENIHAFFTRWDNEMMQNSSKRNMENKIKQSKVKINRKKHII